MAVLKIPQSQSKVRERQVAQTGALTLPFSLATTIGQGFAAIGKVVDDIHKEQVAVEDNNRLLEVIKTASMDINQVSASVSKNTDMKTAIDLFEASTKADKYASLTANDRPRVKKQFNEWLNKTKISEYSSIAKQVTKNHIDKTKTTHNEYLDGLTLMMASSDITKASNARTDFDSFFTKAVNGSVYSSSEFAKLKKDKTLQAEKNVVLFGAKNHPNYTINNYEEIKKKIDPKLAAKALETAKIKIASNEDLKIREEQYLDQADITNKVGTFTELLVRIKQFGVLNDPEFASKMPSLDLLNDLRDANKLNSAQYDALLRFYKDPTAIQDDDALDLISGQLFIAETVEDLDRIQNNMNFSPEYLASIGIKDAVTMNNLIDKFKNDRQIFQDYKQYEKTINNIMGKVENTLIREFGPKEKADQQLRHSAIRIYNEFIDEGLTPEEAFLKVSKGFMANNDKVPTIYDVAEVSSIKIPKFSKIQVDQDANTIFDGLRDKVMEEYKLGNIGIEELKRDIGSLDIMQDVYDIRAEIGDATGDDKFGFSSSNNSTAKGATR